MENKNKCDYKIVLKQTGANSYNITIYIQILSKCDTDICKKLQGHELCNVNGHGKQA